MQIVAIKLHIDHYPTVRHGYSTHDEQSIFQVAVGLTGWPCYWTVRLGTHLWRLDTASTLPSRRCWGTGRVPAPWRTSGSQRKTASEGKVWGRHLRARGRMWRNSADGSNDAIRPHEISMRACWCAYAPCAKNTISRCEFTIIAG